MRVDLLIRQICRPQLRGFVHSEEARRAGLRCPHHCLPKQGPYCCTLNSAHCNHRYVLQSPFYLCLNIVHFVYHFNVPLHKLIALDWNHQINLRYCGCKRTIGGLICCSFFIFIFIFNLFNLTFRKKVSCKDSPLKFEMSGLVTNANYNTKRATFLLFINNRLVHCNTLKKALDTLYASHLPKHTFYFAYMSLDLAPENVDVNVHPTKSEVGRVLCSQCRCTLICILPQFLVSDMA